MTTVSDSFTRANETPLSGNWSTGTSDTGLNLTSNAASYVDDFTDKCSIYTGATWGNDQSSKGVLTCGGSSGAGSGIGLVVRHAPAAKTYYRMVADHAASNNVQLVRFLGGATTTLVTFTRSWTDGATWELQVTGPAAAARLEVFHNSVSVQVFTDNSTLASGSPGLAYSTVDTSGTVDDWVGTDVLGAVAVASLDPQVQWTDDFGPDDSFGPYPFQDDSRFATNTPAAPAAPSTARLLLLLGVGR